MRHSFVYGIGELFAKGPEFVLLPLYIALLAPADYGVVSIAAAVTVVLRPLLSCGLQASALKGYFDHVNQKDRKSFYGSILFLYVVLSGALYLAVDRAGLWWAPLVGDGAPYETILRYAVWSAYLGAAFVELPKEIMRASGRPTAYLVVTSSNVLLAGILTVMTVPGSEEPGVAAVRAVFWGVLLSSVIGIVSMRPFLGGPLNWRWMGSSLKYGLPLVPHFLSHWILSASNRVLIAAFISAAATGVYTAAFLVGWSVSLVKMAMTNALIPLYGVLREGATQVKERAAHVTRLYALVMGAAGAGAISIADFVLSLMGAGYATGSGVAVWAAVGAVALALYNPPVQVLNVTLGRAQIVGAASFSAAALNVALSLWAIPRFGIVGAAGATTVSYVVLSAVVWRFAQRSLRLPYDYRRIGAVTLIPLGGALAARIVWSTPGIDDLVFRLASAAIITVAAAYVGTSKEERKGLWRWITAAVGAGRRADVPPRTELV